MDKKPETKVEKPRRRPVGYTPRLDIINREPGRVYRFIKNDPRRIQEFLSYGYRIEDLKNHLPPAYKVESGDTVDNMLHVGLGDKHLLVSQDEETYNSDQLEKMKEVDAKEAAIKPKPSDGLYGDIIIKR